MKTSNLIAAVLLFLVTWQTKEKCYECGFRYAVGCVPYTPDCGVPEKVVNHVQIFDTVEKVLKFLNTSEPAGAGLTTALDTGKINSPLDETWYIPESATGITVYRAEPATDIQQVKVGTITTTELQRVPVVKDKKEWRLSK